MSNLPTMTRILGSVRIDTSAEQRLSVPEGKAKNLPANYLQISITRDRLVDNAAYQQLKTLVRIGIDYYAMLQTRKKAQEAVKKRPTEPIGGTQVRLKAVLDKYRNEMPPEVYHGVSHEVENLFGRARAESDERSAYIGLLGGLATAGMMAAAYQHEVERRISSIEAAIDDIDALLVGKDSGISAALAAIRSDAKEMRGNKALFAYFVNQSSEPAQRFQIVPTVQAVFSGVERFLRGVRLGTDVIPAEARLPSATYVEWAAVIQNILTNAANAMLDTPHKLMRVSLEVNEGLRTLKFEDSGFGVDLENAENLFEPFVRRTKVSAERASLGLGGSGLGLTIVRMICQRIGCDVAFRKPSDSFRTCIAISWREK
jgi:signal transduction histidine kinase